MEARSTLLRQFLSNLSDCVFSETKPPRRFFAFILTALFGALLLLMLCLGAAPIRNGAWDVVILLNGGWRIVSGQIPHTDYHNPLGPLTYLLVAFGMKVAGPSTAAIPYGIVLLTGCLLPLAWSIAASRFTPFLAFIYVLFNGFLLIAPRVLGVEMRETTYAMIYNREGYVLISLFFVLLFLPRLNQARQKPVFDGLLAGFLLALIFYCKVTYLFIACASLPLAAIFSRPSWKWYISLAAAFIGVCGAAYILFRIVPWSYVHDMMTSVHAQSTTGRMQLLKDEIAWNQPWVYLIFVCLVLWTYVERVSGRNLWSSADLWLIAGWIIWASIGIDAGNTGGMADNPLFFTGCVIPLERFRRRNQEQMQVPMSQACLVQLSAYMIILPHFCLRILAHDAGAFAYATAWDLVKRSSFDTSRQLHAGPLRDLRVPGEGTPLIGAYWYNQDFPYKMNDGLDLLRKHLSADDRVTTFGYTDPFSFAFGLKPCRDANQCWGQTFSFNTNVYPTAEEFLGSATLVMVPIPDSRYTSSSRQSLETMKGLYNNYFQTNFELVDTSQAWLLYRRRSASLEGVHAN
jgi:hypothetical protein